MSYVTGLRCRECGFHFPKQLRAFCDECFGPLEVDYDYEAIAGTLTHSVIQSRPKTIWRYRELLPLDNEPTVGLHTGGTPLVKADRLGRALGLNQLYIKNDAVNFPTLSFKDRVVAVALSKAREFKLEVVGCASTGNLANSVAANAAAAGLISFILIPSNLEQTKIVASLVYGARLIGVNGNYDDANRLCSEISGRYNWGLVNVNLRPFYSEGSKTFGYEIAEALGWRAPAAIIVPMAGGSLITKSYKGFKELEQLGLLEDEVTTRVFGAQAEGCNPIVEAVKRRSTDLIPVKPNTIAKSLAIGDPADGYFAARTILNTGGWAEDVNDAEICECIKLLASTEGIFGETAAGVTVGATRKLAEQGLLPKNEPVVIAITGNGLKTAEVLELELDDIIDPKLSAFEELLEERNWREQAAALIN